MSHDIRLKPCPFCNVYEKYQALLPFIKGLAKVDGNLRDPDMIWRDAETVQDGIDYADHSNAHTARALLEEIGEKFP